MNDSSTRVGGMIWAGYVLLLLFSFSLYWSLLFWAGLAALMAAFAALLISLAFNKNTATSKS